MHAAQIAQGAVVLAQAGLTFTCTAQEVSIQHSACAAKQSCHVPLPRCQLCHVPCNPATTLIFTAQVYLLVQVDFSTASGDACADARRKVQLDGGRPVTRQQVYAAKPPERGHFIAMVVWPNTDFHFFRRDAEGWWSQKRGDTFVTNTYPNGSVVLDVEDPAILGSYKLFCGYFHVDPYTHASTESTWTYSSIPQRLVAVQKQGYAVNSTSMQQPSTGWMRLK